MKKQNIICKIFDKRGRVLSIGVNSYTKTHPKQAHHAAKTGEPERQFLHSEIDAINKCKDLTKAYRIKVYRYNKDGQEMLARPCKACAQAIEEAGIEIVEWTTNYGE